MSPLEIPMKVLIFFFLCGLSSMSYGLDVTCTIKDLHNVPNEEKVLFDEEASTEFVDKLKSVSTKCTSLNRYKLQSWGQAKARGLKIESELRLQCESKKSKDKKACKKQLKAVTMNNDDRRMLFEEYETNLQLCQVDETFPNFQTGVNEIRTSIMFKSLFTLKNNRHQKTTQLLDMMELDKKSFKLNLVDPTTGSFGQVSEGEYDLDVSCMFVPKAEEKSPAVNDSSIIKEHNPIPPSTEQEQLRAIEQ